MTTPMTLTAARLAPLPLVLALVAAGCVGAPVTPPATPETSQPSPQRSSGVPAATVTTVRGQVLGLPAALVAANGPRIVANPGAGAPASGGAGAPATPTALAPVVGAEVTVVTADGTVVSQAAARTDAEGRFELPAAFALGKPHFVQAKQRAGEVEATYVTTVYVDSAGAVVLTPTTTKLAKGFLRQILGGAPFTPAQVRIAADAAALPSDDEAVAALVLSPAQQPTPAPSVGATNRVETRSSAFTSVQAVAVDDAGAAYVTDRAARVVRRVAPDGTTTVYAGIEGQSGATDGPAATATFSAQLADLIIGGGGDLVIADAGNALVRSVSLASKTVRRLAGVPGSRAIADGPIASGTFTFPAALALRPDGRYVVGDAGEGEATAPLALRLIEPGAQLTSLVTMSALGHQDGDAGAVKARGLQGVAVGPDGLVYFCDAPNHAIRRFNPQDRTTTTIAGGTRGWRDGQGANAAFDEPHALAFEASGAMLVADTNNHVLRRVSTGGAVDTVLGKPGLPGAQDGAAGNATLGRVLDVAVAQDGSVYFTDPEAHAVRRWVP